MRNLFNFISNYFSVLLFLFLEVIAVSLIVQESSFHQSAFNNIALNITGKITTWNSDFHYYFNLKTVNDSLARENARLRDNQLSFNEVTADSMRNWKDSLGKPAFRFISAKVISNTTKDLNNFILLNKGKKDGIQSGWGVITNNGVVGVVKDVSENYCSVISLLHNKSKVSVRVAKSNFVSMTWKGYNASYAQIEDIAKHVPLKKGDTIYTSSETWFYPPNLMVGRIADFELNEGSNFYSVNVLLSTDFNNLNFVYVVNPLQRNEIDSLRIKLKDE
jgi:rod shape-determining protein MreC